MKPSTTAGASSRGGSPPLASSSSSMIQTPPPSMPTSPSMEDATVASETPDVFCSLGSLIVEGRVPREDVRGYGEGPHVPGPQRGHQRHECSEDNLMCKKDENFRKHMLLLWQNNVPVSIEVLLCSDCRLGAQKARSVEFSTIPEPGSILLEQWTVSIQNVKPTDNFITSRGLFQAVRSYLHFSQLSAWFSSSRGERPKNVLFRITIPGEAFASKFSTPPEQHIFPPAAVGRGATSSVQVSVRSLPRSDEIPGVICPHNQSPTLSNDSGGSESEDQKLSMAGALAWRDASNSSDSDLRKALVRSKLAGVECQAANVNLPRSDSMDSMLGDSLLDPPQSLQKIPPKRYQSPSRCGSPSLEAPEHLLFGNKRDSNALESPFSRGEGAASSSSSSSPAMRCARQDHLRRRDMNLYYGLHPRVLHNNNNNGGGPGSFSPRLSLPPRSSPTSHGPIRPQLPPLARNVPSDSNDRRQIRRRCTISGKHICSLEEEEGVELHRRRERIRVASNDSSPDDENWIYEYVAPDREDERAAAAEAAEEAHEENQQQKSCDESGIENDVDPEEGAFLSDQWNYWHRSNHSSRRSSLKEEEAILPATFPQKPKKRPSLADIFDDGTSAVKPLQPPMVPNPNPVTQVYRAETPKELDKSEILLGAIIRTSERNKRLHEEEEERRKAEDEENLKPVLASHRNEFIHKVEINHVPSSVLQEEEEEEAVEESEPLRQKLELCNISPIKETGARVRSYSDNVFTNKDIDSIETTDHLEPLDLSFDTEGSFWSEEGDQSMLQSPTDDVHSDPEEEKENSKPHHHLHHQSAIPTSDDQDTFRKSFTSATSMVFHGRTGLPLTSSPAPLRKGKGKFDFDSSITSPHDIKRALFRASSQKSPTKKVHQGRYGKKGHQRQMLSISAPATVVTSSNLLGSFEESVLNGRLEPVSTVQGFRAEIGASGSFHPKHLSVPVTVFFYTLGGDNNNSVSSPYLGHINLGKKGYRIPDKGTIQVTLFNPMGTVVKMFVVMYDLTDMPANSQTFLRQRTLYMPSDSSADDNNPDTQQWLRYLIHLRFASSKSGKIYLHTDIRMIIFRKSDLDTATDHSIGKGYELRSFTRGPTNPKFSPKK